MGQPKRTEFPAWVVISALTAVIVIAFSAMVIMGTLRILPRPGYDPEDPFILYILTTFNFVAFAVFAFILARLLIKLRQERRARRLGSRLKSRLVQYFFIVVILPLILLGVFSYGVINVTIDKWFGEPYQQVQRDSLYIAERYIEEEIDGLRRITSVLGTSLSGRQSPEQLAEVIPFPLAGDDDGKLLLLEVSDGAGKALVTRQAQDLDLTSDVTSILRNARASAVSGREFEQRVSPPEAGLRYLVLATPLREQGRGLTTLYRLDPELAERAANIARQHERYQILHRNQGKIRRVTFQVLGLTTFLLLFVAAWTAMHLAKRITLPIQALAEATRKVARGDLSQTVDCPAEDELAMLVKSFNRMTAQLKDNREKLEASAEQLRRIHLTSDERRRYIETVLESLSTGIISIDAEDRITTLNRAAVRILHLSETPSSEFTIDENLAPLLGKENTRTIRRLIQKARRIHFAAENLEVETLAGISHLVLSASALCDEHDQVQGVVIMIEDITELVRAQRQSVWSEVARRMAHEIKNPLTPIQLSAERMAKNLKQADRFDDPRMHQLVEECTATIVSEVHTLQRMVDEFARFARLPQVCLEEGSLNHIVEATVRLYEDRLDGVTVQAQLAQELAPVRLDSEQIKRALVNLIDNALEAVKDVDGERRVTIETQSFPRQELAQIIVSDTGMGIDPKDYSKLFTPYFSSRPHGTGLGLAIVNRIVAEHHGRVRVLPNLPRGARFIIELPLSPHSAVKPFARAISSDRVKDKA